MSTRYITGAMFAILGGFLVVVSQAFSPSVVGWVAFGVGTGIIVITAVAQLDSDRGCAQRVLDGATVVVSALLIAFGVGASGRAVTWLTFALALGTVGTSFAGLSLNEVANWRLSVGLGILRWLPGSPLREPAMQHPRAA
jgi:hypothetical protein